MAEPEDVSDRFDPDALCEQFVQISGTNSAEAAMFLQENEWNINQALNAFYSSSSAGSAPVITSNDNVITDEPPQKKRKSQDLESSPITASTSSECPKLVNADKSTPVKDLNRIRVLSWNIDGLDSNNIITRTKAACQEILTIDPDIIFLQEVVPPTLSVIKELLSEESYNHYPADTVSYFTMIITKKHTVWVDSTEIIPFYSSQMGRKLQIAKVNVKGIDLTLYTSHLESTAAHRKERLNQLRTIFNLLSKSDGSQSILFGGDLNLGKRDLENVQLPRDVVDVWEATGSRKEAEWTWDTSKNDNLGIEGRRPQCRFDRYYFKPDKNKQIVPVYFELVGLQRVKDCSRFVSDHWGMLAHFDIHQKLPS